MSGMLLRESLAELLDEYLDEHGPDGYPQPMPEAWRVVQHWLLAPPPPASLDAAWARAEAALPGDSGLWLLQGVQLVDTSDSEDLNDERLEWEAEAVNHQRYAQPANVTALGPTPAAALSALADRLEGK